MEKVYDEQALELLDKCLVLNPKSRISANATFELKYFKESGPNDVTRLPVVKNKSALAGSSVQKNQGPPTPGSGWIDPNEGNDKTEKKRKRKLSQESQELEETKLKEKKNKKNKSKKRKNKNKNKSKRSK